MYCTVLSALAGILQPDLISKHFIETMRCDVGVILGRDMPV